MVAFLLLLSSSGFALTIHFCQGEIAGAQWATLSNGHDKDTCCGSDTDKAKDCCADKLLKTEKQSDSVLKYFSVDFPAALLVQQHLVSLPAKVLRAANAPLFASDVSAHAPPLYLLHHQWVLYA